MQVSQSEAASMYARACHAWYGKRALQVAKDSIRTAKQRGDGSGVAMSSAVAAQIAEINVQHRRDPAERGKLY